MLSDHFFLIFFSCWDFLQDLDPLISSWTYQIYYKNRGIKTKGGGGGKFKSTWYIHDVMTEVTKETEEILDPFSTVSCSQMDLNWLKGCGYGEKKLRDLVKRNIVTSPCAEQYLKYLAQEEK